MTPKAQGKNSIKIREANIAVLIRLLVRNGVCSRADLAAMTGLTQASITYITKTLLDWGMIKETGIMKGKTRHPSIGIAIDPSKFKLIGVHLDRRFIRAALCAMDGTVFFSVHQPLNEKESPEQVIRHMHDAIHTIFANADKNSVIVGIGLALPGPFLPAEGRIGLMNGHPGWENVDLLSELKRAYDIPVILEHDANCGALAELWFGGNIENNILFTVISDGIGAGIIADGQLFRGEIGIAGEIGHMSVNFEGPVCECGNRGCLELYCSLKQLEKHYHTGLDSDHDDGKTVKEILRDASAREKNAVKALGKTVEPLAVGLAGLVNVIDPGVIILSGAFADAGETLVSLVENGLSRHLLPAIASHVTVRLASEPRDTAILRGSAVAALQHLLQNPMQYFSPR